MPRKGPVSRRPLAPDPVYQSQLVTQLVNKIMLKGKRSLSERVVYSALEQCRRKTGNDPVTTVKRAVENARPVLRWLVQFSRNRREKTMADRLAGELLDASNGAGAAVKRKEDTHKMAEANKAFAHYRW